MKYTDICKGIFIKRPNRFVAKVMVDGKEVTAHVKNTGRCKELLLPGAEVYLEDFRNKMGSRKLKYSLIAVKKGDLIINMDSQAPNKVAGEALRDNSLRLPGMGTLTTIKPESRYGNSRLDFYVEDEQGKKGFIEVKGVTLEQDRVAKFPDAPTERGVKHVKELVEVSKNGYNAYILFVIAIEKIDFFMPNDDTHREFGDALRNASRQGVVLLARECTVAKDSLKIGKEVPIKLE